MKLAGEPTLAVCELFRSIQGEGTRAGLPCAFVRTAGCNLRCRWCDTEYARSGPGERVPVPQLVERVAAMRTRLVCITGGEPLVQAWAVSELARALLERGHTVVVETNGTLDVSALPEGAAVVMDVKCPGSGECGKTLPGNLERLGQGDEVKFVIADRADFDWAERFVRGHGLEEGPQVLFAPAHGLLEPRELAGWILGSGLDVRLQLQLHRIIWPERTRGV